MKNRLLCFANEFNLKVTYIIKSGGRLLEKIYREKLMFESAPDYRELVDTLKRRKEIIEAEIIRGIERAKFEIFLDGRWREFKNSGLETQEDPELVVKRHQNKNRPY